MKACLDTHTVLWCLADDARLGAKARKLIASSARTELGISDITLLEVSYLFSKGRIGDSGGIAPLLEKISSAFRVLPVDAEIARLALELNLPHGDPFDRVITATAKAHGVPLLTRDRSIVDSGEVKTLW